MTVYGTPSGTPLNSTGFQGTQPGNPVQGTLQLFNPGVGMFPPNSNNASGDSILAAASRGAVPANTVLTNTLAGNGRGNSLLERMSESGAVGSDSTIGGAGGYHPMTNGAGGGSGPGAGGSNQDLGSTAGRDDTLCGAMPAGVISVATPPGFQG